MTEPRRRPPGEGPERFLLPCYTVAAETLLGPTLDSTALVGAQLCGAISDLVDPQTEPVLEPDPEPLVPLVHRRIRVLSNYWHAGWAAALPTTWLRAEAMARLARVADELPARFGLAVFDAWRPLSLQAELWEAAYHEPGLPPGYVADPNPDPTTPPPHLTGGTVDLTLTLDGTPLALGTGFDDFTDRAASDSLESTPGVSRDLRRVLTNSMRAGGFVVLHCEWWHFEFGTRRWAAITGNRARYGPADPPR